MSTNTNNHTIRVRRKLNEKLNDIYKENKAYANKIKQNFNNKSDPICQRDDRYIKQLKPIKDFSHRYNTEIMEKEKKTPIKKRICLKDSIDKNFQVIEVNTRSNRKKPVNGLHINNESSKRLKVRHKQKNNISYSDNKIRESDIYRGGRSEIGGVGFSFGEVSYCNN